MATTVTTKEIGTTLDSEYKGNDNSQLDHFYLLIRYSEDALLSSKLTKVADDFEFFKKEGWKRVDPPNTSSLLYFGEFKAREKEIERDREKRLDDVVRNPLKDILKKAFGDVFMKRAQVIITRACRYFSQEDPMEQQ